ncbi:MAG TPA: hypothetical protein VFD92_04905 [Candidatus Binatia bacterium]|nr:hypothetical protein [Candidatus Binatia bacterium]
MVYLIHFDRPLAHAQHYLGFSENEETLGRRLEHHRAGTGSRLMAAVARAGIDRRVVRIWPEGTRTFERELKNRRDRAHLCPECRAWRAAEKRISKRRVRYRKRAAKTAALSREILPPVVDGIRKIAAGLGVTA